MIKFKKSKTKFKNFLDEKKIEEEKNLKLLNKAKLYNISFALFNDFKFFSSSIFFHLKNF